MNKEELKEVLEKHKMWVKGDKGGVRANLSGADLSRADLSEANLSESNLSEANLSESNLYGANLYGANLSGAYLYGAKLYGANLSRTNLSGANLSGAYLSGAYLSRANLSGANLSGANLSGARLPHFQICPEEGSFIGWKKLSGGVIAKLLIPSAAKRTSTLVGRKCRAEWVEVISGCGWDKHSGKTEYVAGKTVYPDKYDGDIRVECTHGIHFFMTRKEAEEY